MRVSSIIYFEVIQREMISRSIRGHVPGGHPTRGANQSRGGARSRARAVHRGGEFPAGYAVVSAGRRSVAGAYDSPPWDATWGARVVCNETEN